MPAPYWTEEEEVARQEAVARAFEDWEADYLGDEGIDDDGPGDPLSDRPSWGHVADAAEEPTADLWRRVLAAADGASSPPAPGPEAAP